MQLEGKVPDDRERLKRRERRYAIEAVDFKRSDRILSGPGEVVLGRLAISQRTKSREHRKQSGI